MNSLSRQDSRLDEHGFTAIELAAALAATALMMALAFSAVRTYFVRAHVAESVARTLPLQDQIVQMFRASGAPPSDRHAFGQSIGAIVRSSDLESIDVVDGRIEMKFGREADAAIAGRALSLTPFETADLKVVWICGNDIPGIGLQPLGFSGGSRQAIQVLSTIDDRFLPVTCR